MKGGQHLPMYDVRPIYAAVIFALTAAGIILSAVGCMPTAGAGLLKIPL